MKLIVKAEEVQLLAPLPYHGIPALMCLPVLKWARNRKKLEPVFIKF